jgi:hypothetical protein
VAAHLAKYKFTLKTSAPSPYKPGNEKTVPQELSFQPIQSSKEWETGVVYADAQNLARTVPIVFMARRVDSLTVVSITACGASCEHADTDSMRIGLVTQVHTTDFSSVGVLGES